MIAFEQTYASQLEGMSLPVRGDTPPEPALVFLNEELARELGLDPEELRSPDGVAMLAGGTEGLAMAYAGHQFGGFSAQLGDGRAMLLGEVIDTHGHRRDIHLKGSGRTPFSRGGDGKAVLGPVLREVLIGEAMHALGVPTTRALAAVTTGQTVWRDGPQPGAVLARVAASHIRVGTFQFFYARNDVARLRRLAEYTIARHYPELAGRDDRFLALFDAVIQRQMALVAQWMGLGFVHGVMNTDNVALSGETIDYGPCAFMEEHDPLTVFSSIDRQGRYAYGNQPALARWNLARFGECLLPLLADDQNEAVPVLQARIEAAQEIYAQERRAVFAAKLGVPDADDALIDGFLTLLEAHRVDHTNAFRALTDDPAALSAQLANNAAFDSWLAQRDARATPEALARMAHVNPVYIPRNHAVEDALRTAALGDTARFRRLLDVVRQPFTLRAGFDDLRQPGTGEFVTFCGT